MTGYYVVVSGASGSGKTTVARELASALDLPLISKDSIKEAIADVLGLGDVAWSRQLGAAAFEAMYALADEAPSAVLETHWYKEQCVPRLIALGKPIFEVFCRCNSAVLQERLLTRLATRHSIHLDAIDASYVELAIADAVASAPLGIGTVFELDTTEGTDIRLVAEWVDKQTARAR